MAFVRTKRVGRHEYFQLVESRWVGRQPRQRVLVHLGKHPTVDAALEGWPEEIERLRRLAQREQEKAHRLPENPSPTARGRTNLERAERAQRRADDLAAKLKKLHDLRAHGIA